MARIYEFEVYGPDGKLNLALHRPATGSQPCKPDQGPEKAVNGSVGGGEADRWCSNKFPLFLQVDLGVARPVTRFVVKHASAGREPDESDTRDFNIQVSSDGKSFTTVVSSTGAGFVDERVEYGQIVYFDGRREARLQFVEGKLRSRNVDSALDFEEDRAIFAGIFQYFYLRLAIFFGCLGIFMNLFRAEMSNRTLHFWFLAPARREVLLAGKYAAGLIASSVIFGGGAVLTFAALLWPHDAVEVQAYWNAGGMSHAFWYATAAVLGCVGYGSVFLAVGLYVRNPIVPAAVLLGWEGINGILPHLLQKMSVLYYLQSLCPVPAPMESDAPMLIRLLAAPAAPASGPGAILGLLLLTAFALWIAALAVRRMQISYGAERETGLAAHTARCPRQSVRVGSDSDRRAAGAAGPSSSPDRLDDDGKVFVAVAGGLGSLERGEGRRRGRERHAVLLAFLHGVPDVLGHQRQSEIRRVVAGRHAREHRLHERAARRARQKHLDGFVTVEPAVFDERQRFAGRDRLHGAQEVVDELQQGTASRWPDMCDGPAHDGQHGPGLFQRGCRATHEKVQLARLGVSFAAGHGGIDELASARRSGCGEFLHPIHSQRARFDQHGARRKRRKRPQFAEPGRPRCAVIGHHTDGDGGAFRGVTRRRGNLCSLLAQRFGFLGVAVVHPPTEIPHRGDDGPCQSPSDPGQKALLAVCCHSVTWKTFNGSGSIERTVARMRTNAVTCSEAAMVSTGV